METEIEDTDPLAVVTRSQAIAAGHRCLAHAKEWANQHSNLVPRQELNQTTATYWAARATALYSLAALLPAGN